MSFTCPVCGAVSHHPKDEAYGYCGRCHRFTGPERRKGKLSRNPDGSASLFADFKEDEFPITITAFVGDEVIWERIVEPYTVVDIPPATDETAGKVRMRVRLGTGEEHWEEAMSVEEANAHIEQRLAEDER